MSVVERMRSLALFNNMDMERLSRLLAQINEQQLAAGEVLFAQGDTAHTCYIVLTGELEAVARQGDFEMQLEICHPGQIIGEMALIDASPRSATVRARVDSCVAVLDERGFIELLHSNPALTLELLRGNTTRLRRTSQQMIDDIAAKHAELARAYDELQAAQAERIRLSRIEEELAVARRIQRLFLPTQLPQPTGWQLAAYNRGAHEVGGDFFDCIPLPGGQLGLVVADACGKGVPAALFVALTRSLVRAMALTPAAFQQGGATLSSSPAETLRVTNDYIATEHGASHMFITLFYGQLDPSTGQIVYVNAGHNAPMLFNAAGTLRAELESASLPLGIIAGQSFTPVTATIAPGELLVCFSDGITEAMDTQGTLFDEQRLLDAVRDYAALPATELVERLVATVEAFVGDAPQSDDMTLLVLKRDA